LLAKYSMISVNDPYDLVPELFESFPEFVKSSDGDVDILSVAVRSEDYPASNKLTIFIQPEPDMSHADMRYAQQIASRPNAVWALSGFSVDQPWTFKNWFVYLAHLTSTVQVNSGISSVTQEPKSYLATALLGGCLPSRGLLFNEIKRHGLLDQCLVNYHDRSQLQNTQRQGWISKWSDRFVNYRTPQLDQLDDPIFLKIAFDKSTDKIDTCRSLPTTKPGQHGWVSQLIPYNIYNNAYISLVAETEPGNNVNQYCFITEKISKPILLGQPFLVYGGQYYLKDLRSLGFQTFDPWLDESYDLVKDPELRACAVIESLNNFSKLNELEKINRITAMQSAVAHNRALVQNKQWTFGPIAHAIKQNLNLKPA
jgi:hypothetical protein